VDAKGRVIPARTQVLDVRNCLLINTTDWKSGIVHPDEIDAVKRKALDVLRGIRDPATGTAVVTETYARKEEAERFGFDGSAGADICYNLAPGYIGMDTASGPLVQEMKHPLGAHGFAPTRTDMQAVFIAAGPGFPRHQRVGMASLIDIAPTVARLLSISPPAQSRGKSLFTDTKR
jgi:hypothetical protein